MPLTNQDRNDLGCIRCGSYDSWNVIGSKGKKTVDGEEFYVYDVVCGQCGRPAEYLTSNPDAIPERVKIREELFKQETKFDPKMSAESDLYGFAVDKLKPRLGKAAE